MRVCVHSLFHFNFNGGRVNRKMEFLEIVFWSVVILGGVFRVMGWVDWGEILEILGIIVQFRQGGGGG